MRQLIALALVAFPLLAAAQSGTVSPGMPRAKVIAALGEPVTARVADDYTYLFYRNDCGRTCGMHDLVVLHRDSVVDAIFRSSTRHYTGVSSSPEPITHSAARTRTRKAKRPAKLEAPKVEPKAAPKVEPKVAPKVEPKVETKIAPKVAPPVPAPKMKHAAPNDTRPSIPAGEPPVRKPASPTPVKPTTP